MEFDFEQVRKKWTIEKKSPLDVEYTSRGIFNAKKLSTHKQLRERNIRIESIRTSTAKTQCANSLKYQEAGSMRS